MRKNGPIWRQKLSIPTSTYPNNRRVDGGGLKASAKNIYSVLPYEENSAPLSCVSSPHRARCAGLRWGPVLRSFQQGRHARFSTAASLANLLLERNHKGTLSVFLGTLRKAELLVIDEIGFVPLHKGTAELIFQMISSCCEGTASS